jgi:putative membrane protein
MRLILRLVINVIAIWAATFLLPSAISIEGGWMAWLVVAVIFGLVNALIRPIVSFFGRPITCLTLGLFTLVINAAMLGLTALLAGGLLSIQGEFLGQIWNAVIAALVITVVSSVLSWFLPDKKDKYPPQKSRGKPALPLLDPAD